MIVSDAKVFILQLLAEYKYLTTSQFLELGVASSTRAVQHQLYALKTGSHPFIESLGNITPSAKGRLENLYHLSKRGVNFLADAMGEDIQRIRYPKAKNPFPAPDYYHRKESINFHISLSRWAKEAHVDIDLIQFYFDKTGNNRSGNQSTTLKALTRIEIKDGDFYIPDAAFVLNKQGKRNLFLFEMENGKNTLRILRQIAKHQAGISYDRPLEKYNKASSCYTLFVFDLEATKNATLARLNELKYIENYNECFFFNTAKQIKNDFANGWQTIHGNIINFESLL